MHGYAKSHAHNSHSSYFFVCAFTWKQSKYLPQAVWISWITLSWSLLRTEWRTCNLQWVSQMWCWSKEPRHDNCVFCIIPQIESAEGSKGAYSAWDRHTLFAGRFCGGGKREHLGSCSILTTADWGALLSSCSENVSVCTVILCTEGRKVMYSRATIHFRVSSRTGLLCSVCSVLWSIRRGRCWGVDGETVRLLATCPWCETLEFSLQVGDSLPFRTSFGSFPIKIVCNALMLLLLCSFGASDINSCKRLLPNGGN